MLGCFSNLKLLTDDERGVTALEYGLIGGFVVVVIVGAVAAMGTKLNGIFTSITASL